MVVWRRGSLSVHAVVVFVMVATESDSGSAAGCKEDLAVGTTTLTWMVQELGRTISLIWPFLEGCNQSISDSRFCNLWGICDPGSEAKLSSLGAGLF